MRRKSNGIKEFIDNANPFVLIELTLLLFLISAMIVVSGFAGLVKNVIIQWVDVSVAYWISVVLTGLSIAAVINRSYLIAASQTSDIIKFIWSALPIILFLCAWQISSGSLYEIYKTFDSPTDVQMIFYVACKVISGFIKTSILLISCAKLYSGITYLFNRR